MFWCREIDPGSKDEGTSSPWPCRVLHSRLNLLTCMTFSRDWGFQSDLLRFMPCQTQFYSDSLSRTQIHLESLSPTKIHSVSPTSTQCHLDLLCLTQILKIHTDLLSFMQFHSDSLRFISFPQSHSDSLNPIHIDSDPFSHTHIHSDSHSFCEPQTHPCSQIHTDSLRLAWSMLVNPEGKCASQTGNWKAAIHSFPP